MSKIGKKNINIPQGVEIEQTDCDIKIKGPLGELHVNLPNGFQFERVENGIKIYPVSEDKNSRALWGTTAANIKKSIIGVTQAFERKLEVEGVGYKVDIQGKDLVLNIGFSHQVKINIPDTLKVKTEKNTIIINGISSQEVGQFAAKVRSKRSPNAYKGNGIRYSDEIIKKKAGKKIAGATS